MTTTPLSHTLSVLAAERKVTVVVRIITERTVVRNIYSFGGTDTYSLLAPLVVTTRGSIKRKMGGTRRTSGNPTSEFVTDLGPL